VSVKTHKIYNIFFVWQGNQRHSIVCYLLSLDRYISHAVKVCSFFYLFLWCYGYSRSCMTLLIVPLGTSGWHTCFVVIYVLSVYRVFTISSWWIIVLFWRET